VSAGAGPERTGDTVSGAGTCAGALLAGSRTPWTQLGEHPFVTDAADGSLRRAVFDRWLVADHCFVVGFRRFLTGMVALAPDEHAADVLAAGIPALQGELDLFRREAAARGLDLAAEPGPVVLGYTAFLRASLQDGYPVALAVLYGAEKAYFDAWSVVRAGASRDSDYWSFIDNWSSPAFAGWVAALAGLLDAVAPQGPSDAMRQAFDRVVRYELRFWTAVLEGDPW
jgi:formylaminopyrimidine deformylase / aminopyrimidine aminohydrolase